MTILRTAVFALLVPLALPQTPPPASVRGTIRSAETSGPISGATLELRQVGGDIAIVYSTLSSSDGTFLLGNVQPGEYRLVAKLAGYLPSEYGQHRWSGTGVSLNVAAGSQFRDFDIQLTLAGVISGRITERDGEPLGGATVLAMTPSYKDGRRVLQMVQSTVTNDLGEYRLFGLQPGQYYLSATTPRTSNFFRPTFLNSPLQNNIESTNTSALVSGGATQSPIYYPGTPDMRAASPIDLAAGASVSGNNFSTLPIPLRHVRGNVGGSGAHVLLAPLNPAPGSSGSPRDVDARSGSFDFADVIPGDYLVIARSVDKEGRVRIDVRDADVNNVNVELQPGTAIPTHVTIDGRSPVDNDPDYQYVRFNLIPDPQILGMTGAKYSTFPDGSVNFDVTVGEGYRISLLSVRDAPPPFENAYIKSIRMGTREVLKTGLRYNGEPDAKIEIVVGTDPGSLSGSVTTERQQPAINTTVVLVPDAARRARSDAYKTATTDAAGRFQIPAIPPGDYKAFAWEDVEDGAWQDPDFLRRYEDRGMTIHIGESARATMTLSLIR